MKKILAIILLVAMAFSMVACSGGTTTPDTDTTTAPAVDDNTAELAMITDIGTIDDKSFNQGTWEGLKKYAEENSISHKYYKPTEKTTDAYLSAIDLAVKGGAKVIITPGFLFEEPIYIAQDIYPDVKFILIDGNPHNADYSDFRTGDNSVGILFAEEQAGFLAGYAAVKDGYTKLGFLGGMAVPAVVRFGYGFVQGAETAAKEMNIAQIDMKYHYTGGFDATPEAQALAASWYQGGTEVIFGCGGAVGNSAMAAAEQAKAKVIGVDVDQSSESPTVITSAMKGLGDAVYTLLGDFYADKFPGGENLVFDASNKGVGLPMATSQFKSFTQADYDKIFIQLVNDTNKISSGMMKDVEKLVTDIPLEIVKVTEVK